MTRAGKYFIAMTTRTKLKTKRKINGISLVASWGEVPTA